MTFIVIKKKRKQMILTHHVLKVFVKVKWVIWILKTLIMSQTCHL